MPETIPIFRILLLTLLTAPALCPANPVLSLIFRREILSRDAEIEITEGRIFLSSPLSVVFDITNPIRQRMIFRSNTLLLIYPERKEGLRITSRSPVLLPFFHEFLVSLDPTRRTSPFRPVRTENKGDSIYQFWESPRPLPDGTTQLLLVLRRNIPFRTEARTKSGKLVFRLEYYDYFSWGSFTIPGRVESLRFEEALPVRTVITYTLPAESGRKDQGLQDKYRELFHPPAETRWKNIRW